MDRKEDISRKSLYEQDLQALAKLCASVANNRSASQTHADMAHALRVEWVRLRLNHSPHDGKDAEASSKKRMLEFLAGVPAGMMSGILERGAAAQLAHSVGVLRRKV